MNERIEPVLLAQRSALLLIMGAVGLSGWSQPICSIDLGPDITLGTDPVQINGPAGFSNYQWSTGSNSASITTSTPGTYWCQVSYTTGNLVTNGDFSGGNTGFSSEFNYNTALTTEGNYWIGTNAASHHPQFFGTGNGAFLMGNAGWMHAGYEVWCQTHTVCPGQTYALSFRATSLATQGAPTLQWYVDGEPTWVNHQTSQTQGSWQSFTTLWTAPANSTQASFCIEITSGHGIGNDFGVDDISISSTVVLTDQIEVLESTLPIELISFTGEAIKGESHLDWSTGSERDNDHFLVLRSADLIEWEEIARILGAGYSQTVQDYHAVDRTPLAGINYYTLMQVDHDGTETRSPVVAIDHVGDHPFLIGPNPALVGVPIQFQDAITNVRVTDQQGRSIPYLVSGNSLSILAGAGIYVVTMKRGASITSVRVILQ
ncbi:MAG: hypothetical protein IPH05_03770 [Flavobacteriales bacterium]|jgi:hypothetical protein|nr:hypothetical protein [Flavobacteriales bacterium]MBK6551532.1 hypothetical protein [Flavobacteriales bacterium]MBK6882056.1 hypothetical protein [Flavobacteriales bacterium]MBK7103512.1 hypothetical protein [Flavobacteriales bacterium]MBK7112428.1 hypothetical protein [Flavobacteriales bacterium]